MNLKQNLIDNIIECELKLGHDSKPISFFYPKESMLELLGCKETELFDKIGEFISLEHSEFCDIKIEEDKSDKGRFVVIIPSEGVDRVSNNYVASDFMKAFINEIQKPHNTVEDVIGIFRSFSDNVIIKKVSDDEWAIYFADDEIDSYVYHIEQNDFGVEYHRFSKEAYKTLYSKLD